MEATEIITFAIAVIGAVLGILNFWRSVIRDSYRVRVIPKHWLSAHGSGLSVEVINMGNFAITVDEVGIALKGDRRLAMHDCYLNGLSLPERLEPRTSITIYAAPGTEQDPQIGAAIYAFAKTSCGKTFKGKSGYLKSIIKNRRPT